MDVIPIGPNAATFADFHRHTARDVIARCEVLILGRITFHEPLAFRVGKVTAFAACALGDQAACAVDTGWVELNEFHVLEWQASACHHAATVTCAGVGRCG